MGNKQNKEREEGLIQYDKFGAVLVKETEDPQTGDKFQTMQFSRQVPNEKEYNDWVKQMNRIEDSQSRQTIFLPEKHTFVKAGLCGNAGNVNLTYQNFPFVLNNEIFNRKKLSRYFNEAEMWYLLYSMIRAANKFEKIKKKIGDVSPSNVLINDDGQIKLLSTCSLPNEINNFHKIIQDKNAYVYLAPEQLQEESIQKGEYPSNIDQCKAEVFSIGLTILSSGILEDCYSIYEGNKVNQHRLNQFLGIFREKYSPYLFSTLVKMLEIRPNLRRSASDIYNELSPHQQNILELQPFHQPSKSNFRPINFDPSASGQYAHNAMSGHQSQPHNMNYGYPALNSGYQSSSAYGQQSMNRYTAHR